MHKFGYLSRTNMEYIEGLYQSFLNDPQSVSEDWRTFFEGVEFAQNLSGSVSSQELDVYNLITSYRDYGHFDAKLDPLSLAPANEGVLKLKDYNLKDDDLKKKFSIGSIVGKKDAELGEIINHLKKSYCGTISCQTSDTMPRIREWFSKEFEQVDYKVDKEEKKSIYQQLVRTETLEMFIHRRFQGTKRFSIEGADALIPMLHKLVNKGTSLNVEEIVIGMAHRGRINVLTNFMDKELDNILAEFAGTAIHDEENFDSDVKYHLGYSADKKTPHGDCHISLAFNPSHLEAVNTVVLGMTRAKQRVRKDTGNREKVVPVLIHGDAAVAGQGVVFETLQMSQLKGYTVGGTIHVVIDNQVGFTTNPESGRSSPYSTDVGKSQQIPVIHVNGDDVEACVRAMDIAIRFRQEFKRDIFINLTCYRRYGHNEGDEPMFTQPQMYDIIKKHPTLRTIYGKELIKNSVIDEAFFESFYQEKMDNLQQILDDVKANPPKNKPIAFGGVWEGMRRPRPEDFETTWETKASQEHIDTVGKVLTTIPPNFTIHKKLQRLVDSRKKMVEETKMVDWGMGELLAYGSLILEGNSVRLSGQDCIRGTFTHRHSCFFDQNTGEMYNPLKTLREDKEFCVYNSFLSEMGVLGFEYGNSSSDPTFLTIWEAQFGDFANGAQIIIDQFLASAEQKWMRMSGLTLLLPHGYEGQGPEHSSARLERFLQLCAQQNMQVCNLTTPAQLFHAMRRQMRRDFRLPLVIMSPKSLLRHPRVVSPVSDLTDGFFAEVIGDKDADPKKVNSVVLVSGKLYYELLEKKESLGVAAQHVALVRVEQLYPYPENFLVSELKRYKGLKSVIWAQEEPKNMGSWRYISPFIRESLDANGMKDVELKYEGRTFRASPATGNPKIHMQEQNQIIDNCF